MVVVVGLQGLHLLWYGLELGSDPPSPLWYHRSVVGVTGFPPRKTCGFRLPGRSGDGRRSR